MNPVPTGSASPLVALSIGGSDSMGGCGVQADLRTFASLGAHGVCALTIVTAQNSTGVQAARPLDAAFVGAQLDAVLDDVNVAATKTGMLATPAVLDEIASRVGSGRLGRLVVDPVLVDARDRALFDATLVRHYLERLAVHADALTPNSTELALLCDRPIHSVDDLERAAIALADRLDGPAVVAKGGRLGGPDSVDVLARAGVGAQRFSSPRVATTNVAGTGDTLSAALAVQLGRGADIVEALAVARSLVGRALRGAQRWRIGAGSGPLDQFGWSATANG
ncbi:MAG: bifunctional hydroxymethylpyrimidine kinase/phosphomethylpyrimidine kinase [Acidimicrobiia bacterium]|nr:bifunctional hydroxymethylpyrimidine kinase/phosphomethylpyrimidine kinase [Acidimicrobiia bacterium]